MLKLAASGLVRRLPHTPRFRFPALRWLVVHYIGDAVAYQVNGRERELYDQVHAVLARILGELAKEAGEDARLCVVAHSLSSVVASNFFYDLQVQHGRGRPQRPLIGAEVAADWAPSHWSTARRRPSSTAWAARLRCGPVGWTPSANRCSYRIRTPPVVTRNSPV